MEKISPQAAIELLREGGMLVTLEQATLIVEFLYNLADTVITQYLENENR